MAFMIPYWLTVALIVIGAVCAWVSLDYYNEPRHPSRSIRIMRNLAWTLSVAAGIGVLLGIWIPFFIPGLY